MMDCQKKLNSRQYLKQIELLDMQINDDLIMLSEMKSKLYGVGAVDYSENRVQTSLTGNSLCTSVTGYVAVEEHINREIDKFIDVKQRIIKEIRELHDKTYIHVLTEVYVHFKTIRELSREMKKSYSNTCFIHRKALESFGRIHKELHYLI